MAPRQGNVGRITGFAQPAYIDYDSPCLAIVLRSLDVAGRVDRKIANALGAAEIL
jgi:hypothetical protein